MPTHLFPKAPNGALSLTLLLTVLANLLACAALAQEAGWSAGAPMPTARSEIASAELDGRIYVAGGLAQFGTTDAFEVYDPTTNSWKELAPLPEGRHHLALTALGGKLYLTGGYADLSFSANRKNGWAYDPAKNAWQPIADMPGPRAAHRTAAVGDKLYVAGGVGTNPLALWAYDPATNSWEADLAELPTAREHLAVAGAGGKLYVIAGRWGNQNLTVLEAYDPASNSWNRLADLPAPRGALTAAVIGERIHVTGGEDLNSADTYDDHWIYDPASDRWEEAKAMPTSRHGLDSSASAGRWYVIGGGTGAGFRTFFTLSDAVEIYQP